MIRRIALAVLLSLLLSNALIADAIRQSRFTDPAAARKAENEMLRRNLLRLRSKRMELFEKLQQSSEQLRQLNEEHNQLRSKYEALKK